MNRFRTALFVLGCSILVSRVVAAWQTEEARSEGLRVSVALRDGRSPREILLLTVPEEDHVKVFDISDSPPKLFRTLGVSGKAAGQLDGPHGAWLAGNDNLYVLDSFNARVQVFDFTAIISQDSDTHSFPPLRLWGEEGKEPGKFNLPVSGIVVTHQGRVLVGDTRNHRIQVFDELGQLRSFFGGFGSGDGKLKLPGAIALSTSEEVLFVSDSMNGRVCAFDTGTGGFLFSIGRKGGGPGEFGIPTGIAVDREDSLYVLDRLAARISRFRPERNADGGLTGMQLVGQWGNAGRQDGALLFPEGIAVDSQGRVYIVERAGNRGQVFTKAGTFVSVFYP